MRVALVLIGSLVAGTAPAQERPPAPLPPPAVPGHDWRTAGRDPAATRFSPLDQITADNLVRLEEAWRFDTGIAGPHEGGPLVVDSVMYLHTPFPNQVFALDLREPGRVLWQYTPPVSRIPPATGGRDIGSRGLAWHPSGIIYVPILPGDLAALDARTGREIWRVRNADARLGASMSSAPLVAGDVVVVGMAGSEYGVRGYLSGYRAANGQLLWRGSSTGSDAELLLNGAANVNYLSHAGRNLGVNSWPGEAWRTGGGTTDGWLSWDPELGLVYAGTGAPAPWQATLRPGESKWTSAIVAREVATGRVRWAYQLTPGDAWGYGAESENILADLQISGQPVKALIHIGRNGFAYTLDRTTGRILAVERAGPVNWASAIDRSTAIPSVNPRFLPGTVGTTRGICPATVGLKGGAPAAFSPASGLVFAPVLNFCMDVRPATPRFQPGVPSLGATWQFTAGPGGARGRLIAWDPAAGAIRWEARESLPILGGTLVTASGLVFYPTSDGWLKAVDALNGRELWRQKLPAPSVGTPMTYLGPDGRQYLAILTGPGGWPAVDDFGSLPDLPWSTAATGLLVVFALPPVAPVPE